MNDKQQARQAAREKIRRSSLKTFYVSSLLCLPVVYITYLFVHDRFAESVGLPITIGVYLVSLTIIMRLIRRWLYKKPPTSGWYTWLN